LFHLLVPGGKWQTLSVRTRLVGQALQLPFPQPQAPAVAATAIGGDQQPPRAQIQAAAPGAPLAADRSHRDRARVMLCSHVDEAGIAPQVIDPVGICAGNLRTGKIMPVDLVRRPRFAPLAALVLVVADLFHLLRVHDGLTRPQSLFDGAVDIPELRIAIRMIVPLLPRLLPAAVAVVAIRGRPGRQDRECLLAKRAPAPANADPVVLVVVCLLPPAPVAGDRRLPAHRTPSRHLRRLMAVTPARSCLPATVVR